MANDRFSNVDRTLITAAGFYQLPRHNPEQVNTHVLFFQVVTIALIVSWIAAVLFVPYLGENCYLISPNRIKSGMVFTFMGKVTQTNLHQWLSRMVHHDPIIQVPNPSGISVEICV